MKLKKFIIFALLILIVSAVFSACNTGSNLPSDGTVNVETANQDSATQSESTTSQEKATQAENSASVYYSKEEDDLEIMTVPNNDTDSNNDSEDKGEETPATNAVIENQPENDGNKQEETRIELPFIPAN